jgi:hypothetical protein
MLTFRFEKGDKFVTAKGLYDISASQNMHETLKQQLPVLYFVALHF